MSWRIDHRWATGASRAEVPADAPAVYSARWIDLGDVADIVHDRQGFAYDDTAELDRLITVLNNEQPHRDTAWLPRDETHRIINRPDAQVWARRAGGYVYVEAWLVPS